MFCLPFEDMFYQIDYNVINISHYLSIGHSFAKANIYVMYCSNCLGYIPVEVMSLYHIYISEFKINESFSLPDYQKWKQLKMYVMCNKIHTVFFDNQFCHVHLLKVIAILFCRCITREN